MRRWQHGLAAWTSVLLAWLTLHPAWAQSGSSHEALASLSTRAEQHFRAREWAQACGALREYLELCKDRPDSDLGLPRFQLGVAAYFAREWNEARQQLTQFESLYPDDNRLELVWLYLGDMAMRDRDFATATAYFQRGLARFPDGKMSPQYWLGMGYVEYQCQRYPQASEWLTKLVQTPASVTILPKDQNQARYWLGKIDLAGHDFDAAQRTFQELLAAAPEGPLAPAVTYHLGIAYLGAKRYEEATEILGRFGETPRWATDQPQLPEAQAAAEFGLADEGYRRGEFADCRQQLESLRQRLEERPETEPTPWTAIIYLRLAQTYGQLAAWQAAFDMAHSLGNRFPQSECHGEAEYVVGRSLAAMGRLNEAREAYERVIRSPSCRQSETAALAQWMIGETYFHQKNYRQAIRAYQLAVTAHTYPAWQAAGLLQAGKCHEVLGDPRSALDLYTRVLKQFAETPFHGEAQDRLRILRTHQDHEGTSHERST